MMCSKSDHQWPLPGQSARRPGDGPTWRAANLNISAADPVKPEETLQVPGSASVAGIALDRRGRRRIPAAGFSRLPRLVAMGGLAVVLAITVTVAMAVLA
jgi:hypothetical protein